MDDTALVGPSPYEAGYYIPPRPTTDQARQLVVNRLGLWGGLTNPAPYADDAEGDARAKARLEQGDALAAEGNGPGGADESFEISRRGTVDTIDSSTSGSSGPGISETKEMVEQVRQGRLPPDTLEQHPVFRKIVKQCRCVLSLLTLIETADAILLAGKCSAPRCHSSRSWTRTDRSS